MLFSARSALPSSPLQLLSNKSTPARLFNKHFAPSDECAALLKCLFSFCLGGQPTVVYLTVNKQLESLELHASSPQWSLAAFQRQRGKKAGSIQQVPYRNSSTTGLCSFIRKSPLWFLRRKGIATERERGCWVWLWVIISCSPCAESFTHTSKPRRLALTESSAMLFCINVCLGVFFKQSHMTTALL